MNIRSVKSIVCFFAASLYLTVSVITFAGTTDGNISSPQRARTMEKFGVSFQLQGCKKTGENVSCRIKITSYKFDKRLAMTTSQQRLTDNVGNEYRGTDLQIGDKESSSWLNSSLKADLPINAVIHFQNLSAKADSIDRLEIVGSLSSHGKSNYVNIPFKDISFSN